MSTIRPHTSQVSDPTPQQPYSRNRIVMEAANAMDAAEAQLANTGANARGAISKSQDKFKPVRQTFKRPRVAGASVQASSNVILSRQYSASLSWPPQPQP